MPVRPCPVCQHPAPRVLEALTEIAEVIYYRCDKCGNVWHVTKLDPDGPAVVVTDNGKPKD